MIRGRREPRQVAPHAGRAEAAEELAPVAARVLDLQQTAGNAAVQRLVGEAASGIAPEHAPATAAIQRTKAEASDYVARGERWNRNMWIGNDTVARDQQIGELNRLLSDYGVRVSRGFQPYDPVVHTGTPLAYKAIVAKAQGQDDGGKAWAQQFLDWTRKDVALSALPRELQALAVITHWAEVARGYKSSLQGLYAWMEQIAGSEMDSEAREAWGNYNDEYPPSLTYGEDTRREYQDEEMSESSYQDDDSVSYDAEAEEESIRSERADMGELPTTRLRPRKKK